jgi:hypothetical protein
MGTDKVITLLEAVGSILVPKIIELDIEWPESDIGGLQEDGNYYSSTPGGSCLGFRLSARPAPKQAGKPA